MNFITGDFRGSENEMYPRIQLGAWQHQRVFLLYALATLACFVGFVVAVANQITIPDPSKIPDIIQAILTALKPSLAYVFCCVGYPFSLHFISKHPNFKNALQAVLLSFQICGKQNP